MRILVVEDEKPIATLISRGLEEKGYQVQVSENGDDAFELAKSEPFDAIILDIMLPGRDGLSILRGLREEKVTTPVLVLTARGQVSERVEGLDLGADDYLSKPFSVDELLARLRACMRRRSGETLSFYKVADLTLNLVSREVVRGKRKIDLTTREFDLLAFLMRSPGTVFTRTQIHEKVWEYHFDPGTNLVDVYIQRLRRKVDDGENVKLLQTVRGVGYSVNAPA
jgi:two-component system OmpR family response regulator